jgi:type VI protein secretion system component VasF
MTSPNAAKVKQDRKLAFVPVWPVVAAFVVLGLAVWLAGR